MKHIKLHDLDFQCCKGICTSFVDVQYLLCFFPHHRVQYNICYKRSQVNVSQLRNTQSNGEVKCFLKSSIVISRDIQENLLIYLYFQLMKRQEGKSLHRLLSFLTKFLICRLFDHLFLNRLIFIDSRKNSEYTCCFCSDVSPISQWFHQTGKSSLVLLTCQRQA